MVNLGLRRVEESVAAKHPALRQYAACQSHAFLKGIGAFLAGSGAAFAVQKLVNKKLPYTLQWNLLLSVAAGSLASYMVTKAETQKCSDFWIYLETGKSPQEHTMADGLSQPTENLSPEDAKRVIPPVRRNKYGDIVEQPVQHSVLCWCPAAAVFTPCCLPDVPVLHGSCLQYCQGA